MSIPQPKQALDGHCSTIDSDTLYVLSSTGLQSLPLKENGTWSEEPSGQAVTGPACVNAGQALYVIGGSTNDNSYGGLQRYWFGNKTWETLSPAANVMQGRTDHSAAYLSDTQSILVYAGSQPVAPSDLSSQTFLIDTYPPYNIESFTSEAPPTNAPVLLPWNSSHAVMLGGASWNTEVYTFGPDSGWQQLGTNLSQALDPATRATLLDGTDGSKVLELYDVSTSPNQVSQVVLLDANGQTAATGQTIGGGSSGSSPSRKRKRDLTLSNWPSYNKTDAPTATRTDCSVAQGSSGLAVLAGGSSAAPVAMFNQNTNGWIDAGKFFNGQQPLQPSSTLGTASTSSPTTSHQPSTSSSAGGGAGGISPHDRMLRTLGITLGVLCGIAAIFILILLFMRWRKMRQKKKEGYIDEKTGNRMSFADRGASFMKEAGGSINNLAPPNTDKHGGGSHTSLAIIAGKFGNKRNTSSHAPKDSYESTAHLVKDRTGNMVVSEPVEMVDIGDKRYQMARKPVPVPRTELTPPAAAVYGQSAEMDGSWDERKRSSGWSKYFATSGPTGPNGLSHLPAAYMKPNPTSDGSEYSTDKRPSQMSRIPSTSVLVPPLDIDFSRTLDGQRLSHVTTGSPAFMNSTEDLAKRGSLSEAQRGLIVNSDRLRPNTSGNDSVRSRISGEGLRPKSSGGISGRSLSSYNRSTMGSTLSSNLTSDFYNDSGNTPWTPVSNTFKDHLNSRPHSSNYTSSIIEQGPRVPSRGKSGGGFFPGAGVPTSFKTSTKTKMGHTAAPSADWAAPKGGAGLSLPSKPAEDRDSTLTVFPRGVPSTYYANREKDKAAAKQDPNKQQPMTTDMSWLNLRLNGQNKI